MIEMVEVAELKVIGDHSLWLRFSDGQEGVRDCSDILAVVVRWLNLSAIPRCLFARFCLLRSQLAERVRPRCDQSPHGAARRRRSASLHYLGRSANKESRRRSCEQREAIQTKPQHEPLVWIASLARDDGRGGCSLITLEAARRHPEEQALNSRMPVSP
jgi:hypothetical protein